MTILMVALQASIAVAYVVLGARWVPRLGLPYWAAIFGWGFFLTCAATHAEMAIHTYQQPSGSGFLTSPHMLVVHGSQAFFDWAFILATIAYSIELRVRPRRGPATPPIVERGFRHDDAVSVDQSADER